MTKEELALALDGIEYGKKFPVELMRMARESRLVVVHGNSDDIVRLDGCITKELGDADFFMTGQGLLKRRCNSSKCPYFEEEKSRATRVGVFWDPPWNEGFSWVYQTEIPNSTFKIIEDGEVYCNAMVFCLSDVAGLRLEGQKERNMAPALKASMVESLNETILQLTTSRGKLLDMLEETVLQIEYLHGKFKETGSGNQVVTRAKTLLEEGGV